MKLGAFPHGPGIICARLQHWAVIGCFIKLTEGCLWLHSSIRYAYAYVWAQHCLLLHWSYADIQRPDKEKKKFLSFNGSTWITLLTQKNTYIGDIRKWKKDRRKERTPSLLHDSGLKLLDMTVCFISLSNSKLECDFCESDKTLYSCLIHGGGWGRARLFITAVQYDNLHKVLKKYSIEILPVWRDWRQDKRLLFDR